MQPEHEFLDAAGFGSSCWKGNLYERSFETGC
jgi:hypothetical protein